MIEPNSDPFDPALSLPAPATGGQPARPWLITFADLICVLLSFFVLLANVSKIEHDRVKDALQSLGETLNFGTEGVNGRFGAPPEGEAIQGQKMVRERLAGRIREIFPGARISETPAKNELQFSLARNAVVADAAIRPEAKPALADIAAALARGTPGFRFLAQATTGTGTDLEGSIAAVSLVARALVESGAPKQAVAAGIDGGSVDEFRVTIRAEAEDAPRLDFRKVVPE